MISIAVDGNEANTEKRVGTGQYAYQILRAWAATKTEHEFHIFLRQPPRADMPVPNSNWHYHVIGPQKAWTRFALPLELLRRRGSYDVFWNPAHYLPPVTFCPSVVTIHDLAYEFFPNLFLRDDLYKLRRWSRASVARADKVIAVSEATKSDLVKLYSVPKAKITVIPNGYDSSIFNLISKISPTLLEKWNLKNGNYIMYLGTLQPRKNVMRLIQAFRLLKSAGYAGRLVIAGNIGWMAGETLEAIKASQDTKDIVLTGYIADETRAALFRFAGVFVLPSLYEGFGVPLLEAMASGCPVTASDNSSLPEVTGDAGVLFDPHDPADIARAITEIGTSRQAFIKKGLARVKLFAWDKCAGETLNQLLETAKPS